MIKVRVVNPFKDKNGITRSLNEILEVEKERVENLVTKGFVEPLKEQKEEANLEEVIEDGQTK